MKVRVGKEDCIFYINEEKRTVTCLIKYIDDRPVIYAAHNFLSELEFKNIQIWPDGIDNYIKRQYVGVAKCSPEDKWDEETGKKLAFARAKMAFYKDFFHTFSNYICAAEEAVAKTKNIYNTIFDKAYSNIQKTIKQIGENV